MKLSLSESATVLGRSERQIRYLIKTGRLRAGKDGGRWRIESTDLPLTDAQREAVASRVQTAREAFEKGIAPAGKIEESKPAAEKKRYSVKDLKAFQSGEDIYRELKVDLGREDSACQHLFAALVLMTRGCHTFHPGEKAARFTEARDAAAHAATHLFLDGDEESRRRLAERIEQELIPKIASLVAGQEKRSHRTRFDRFGCFAGRDRKVT